MQWVNTMKINLFYTKVFAGIQSHVWSYTAQWIKHFFEKQKNDL